MKQPRISAIAAIGQNRELGRDNKLLWKLDADFKRLRKLTHGNPLIMGRKTYESIGRELPHSPSIVITRQSNYQPPYPDATNTTVVSSLNEAFEVARTHTTPEIFIFGGAQIYAEALPHVERLYLTAVEKTEPEADSFFPDYSEFQTVLEDTVHEENGIRFHLLTLEH